MTARPAPPRSPRPAAGRPAPRRAGAPGRALRTLAAATLVIALPAFAAAAPGRPDPAAERALRERTIALFERREQARLRGGVPLDSLARELDRLAGDLEAAGLDTLASRARYRAAGVNTRIDRDDEAERQLQLSIASAVRARAESDELSARAYLADLRVGRDPDGALALVRPLFPRLAARKHEIGLGDVHMTASRAAMALGRTADALESARKAARHYRRGNAARPEANALCAASQALRHLDRHGEALAIADTVIALAARNPIGVAEARAWLERASVMRLRGRLHEGLAAADRALAIDRKLGDRSHLSVTRRFRAALLAEAKRFRECLAETDSLALAVESNTTQILATARLRALALIGLGRAHEAETTLASRLAAYERFRARRRSDEDRASTGLHATSSYATLGRAILAQGRAGDAWRASESGRARSLKARLGIPDTPALEDLLSRLARERAALVQFDSPDPDEGTVYVLARGRVEAIPVRREARTEDVNVVRARLSSSDPPAPGDPAFARLASALLADVWPHLGDGIERLVIVPPASLDDLPFEALPAPGAPGERLGDRFAVRYLPAAALLPFLEDRPAPGVGSCVVADPAIAERDPAWAGFDPAARARLARPLPGARREARRLAGAGYRVLAGRGATLDQLRSRDHGAMLHFATHALEHPRLAPSGALVLAGNPALLTAAAIESLGVAADLVTLSACRALGSKSYWTEGAYGLTRAFLVAGARGVVGTRWEVSDRAAERCMELFHAELAAGRPRDVALARATRRLGREGFAPRDRWAFLLTGAATPRR